MFTLFLSLLTVVTLLISTPTWATIDWAGNFSPSIDPFSLSEDNGLTVSIEVYKKGVTEALGQGEGIFSRFYVDVPHGIYVPMKYAGDHGNNDVYAVFLEPFMLKAGLYQVAVGVNDLSVSKNIHWSEGNFYWVTKESYGYTNASYPNHEWMNSFRIWEIVRSESAPPIFNNQR